MLPATRDCENPLMEAKEIAERLHISTCTVYDWVRREKLPFVNQGGRGHRILFHRADFERWCKEGSHAKITALPAALAEVSPGVQVLKFDDGVEVTITLSIKRAS